MIDLKNRILFIHIPKTGGQSIEKYFREIRGIPTAAQAALGLHLNDKKSPLERHNGHNTLEMYENYFFGGEIPDDFKCFTVVRHPVSRFWSEHGYRRIPSSDRSPVTFRPSSRQLIRIAENPIPILKDLNAHLKPQVNYIRGRSIQRVRILHQENLTSEFSELCEEWNLPKLDLPRANASKHQRHRRDEADIIDWIYKFYAEDFNYFEYN